MLDQLPNHSSVTRSNWLKKHQLPDLKISVTPSFVKIEDAGSGELGRSRGNQSIVVIRLLLKDKMICCLAFKNANFIGYRTGNLLTVTGVRHL